ncbi:MAG: aminotransferase class I/II-fold pyridoxal phosphate-dependent enzyme, partial [Acutalibacteraceae bacterium]
MYLLSKRAAQVAGSLTLAIDAKAKAMKSQGVDVVSYGAGEPDFDTPLPICQAAIRAIEQGQTRYTPARGTLELRRAICEKLARRNNLTYTPDEIVVTNGAKQALHDAFSAILEEDDEVILMTPCWVSYPELIRMAGGIPVLVERNKEDGFALDLQALESAVTEKTKAIVINSPDNPCGGVLSN